MFSKIREFIKNLFRSNTEKELAIFAAEMQEQLNRYEESIYEELEQMRTKKNEIISCDCDICTGVEKVKKPITKKRGYKVTAVDPSKGVIEIEETKPKKKVVTKKPRTKKTKGAKND